MKTYWTTLLTFLTFFAFAQKPTGDIQQDTALANRNYEEALDNGIYKREQSIKLLEQSILLYKNYPFNEKILSIKGQLARLFGAEGRYEEAENLAFAVITLGQKEFPNKKNIPALKFAYTALSESVEDNKEAIKYGLKSRECVKDDLPEYFAESVKFIYHLMTGREYDLSDSLITDLDHLANSQGEESKRYAVYVYKCKMVQSHLLNDFDQAIIYGEKFFYENEVYNIYVADELSPTYLKLGEIYSELGKYDEAIKATKKGMEVSKDPKDHPRFGVYYTYLANVYREKKMYPIAIEHYEKGIKLMLKDSSVFQGTLGIDYYDLSNIYLNLGDFNNAVKCLKESSRFYPSPIINFQLGNILYDQGKIEEAIIETHKALIGVSTSFKEEDFSKNPSVYEIYSNDRQADAILHHKGYFLYDLGEQKKDIVILQNAIESATLSLNLIEKNWQSAKGFDNSRFFHNQSMVSTLTTVMLAQELIYELEPSEDNFNKYFEAMERLKALQLIETLSPSPLPKALYAEEQKIIQSIQDAGQYLEIMRLQDNKDSIKYYQNELFQANEVLEDYQKRIQKEFPKVVNHFYNLNYVTLQDIRKELGEKSLFITYSKGRREDLITTISTTDKKIIKIKSTDLKAKIERFNELIQDRFAFQKAVRDEFIDISHELYKTLIEPIEAELEGKTKLMVVLQGELFHLPFELLLASNEKKPYHELDFLIKKHEINYHYSATAFQKLKEKKTVKNNSLLAFAPVFKKGEELNEATRGLDFMVDSLYRSIENFEFIALPNTKKEVKAIAKLIKSKQGNATVLLNRKATKVNLSQHLEKQPYQFIHIATHGLVNFKTPKLSALACYSKNEMMNNLMYTNEIQFKNINADLVVLSSCESGIGQFVAGEGLIALSRSFIYSGAKNVLFSLWKVNDKYSSQLMIDFYKNYLTTDQSYTSALRQAKLKMLANPTSAQPKYWSAFVLMGE